MQEDFTLKGKEAERHIDVLGGLASFHNQFNYENNDRAIVIVGIAYVEDLLLYCLHSFFPSGSSTINNMLSHKGFLGTYTSKVNLLYGLGFLSKIVKQDLDKLGEIRNKFAHKTTISFNLEEIEKLVIDLNWHKHVMLMEAPIEATTKEKFKVGVNCIVSHLSGLHSICRAEKRQLKK